MTTHTESNWPVVSDQPVPVLVFRWTDTHSIMFSGDHILTIAPNVLRLDSLSSLPEFVKRSQDLVGEIKLDLAGIEQLEEMLPTIKAILRGETPAAAPSLYIKHFE